MTTGFVSKPLASVGVTCLMCERNATDGPERNWR